MSMHDPVAASTPDIVDADLDDPVALLEGDHEAVEELFRQCEDAGLEPPTELLRDLGDLLTGHALVEEEVVYPALDADLQERSVAEHGRVKALVAELLAAPDGGPEVASTLTRLIGEVRAHVSEERATTLPALAESLSPGDRAELAVRIATSKAIGTPRLDDAYPVSDASVSTDESPDYLDPDERA